MRPLVRDPSTGLYIPNRGTLGTIGTGTISTAPICLYHFDSNLNDSSGNGLNLTVAAGTESYSEIWPGIRGANLDGATRLTNADTGRLLQKTGAITTVGLLWNRSVELVNGSSYFIYTYGANGETLATNVLHSWYWDNQTADQKSGWYHEHGSGVNDLATIDSYTALYEPVFYATTRDSGNLIRFYMMGKQIGATSAALTAAAGGTTSTLNIGANESGSLFGSAYLRDFAIYDGALSAADILTLQNTIFAQVYGEVA